jgi:hypothetical protein
MSELIRHYQEDRRVTGLRWILSAMPHLYFNIHPHLQVADYNYTQNYRGPSAVKVPSSIPNVVTVEKETMHV